MSANASSSRSPRAVAAGIALAAIALGGGACQDDPKSVSASAQPGGAAASSQSFDEAMHVVCDAPDKAELPPESAGEANRAMMLAVWMDKHVSNHEVRQLLGGKAAGTPARKLQALESGAHRAGITRCALADLWQAGGHSRLENKP
jgi:hypothetical protein